MTSRLDLKWKLDGLVDEQRYYRSESPIDVDNLPAPKTTFLNEDRSYVDNDIDVGKTYYIRIGSVRNSIEKISNEVKIYADKDKYWSNVVSLLWFNGINGSQIFTDERGFNWNVGGSAKISTNQSKFGGSSGFFNGLNDYLSTGISNNFNLSDGGDFTVECFVYCENTANSPYIFHFYSSNQNRWAVSVDSQNGYLSIYTTVNNTVYLTTSQLPLFEWNHIALTRKDGVTSLFLNGVSVFNENIPYHNSSSRIVLGSAQFIASSNYFSGFIDSFRVTKGVCRYVENFTPPIIDFPNK